jgi:hypothetical protein
MGDAAGSDTRSDRGKSGLGLSALVCFCIIMYICGCVCNSPTGPAVATCHVLLLPCADKCKSFALNGVRCDTRIEFMLCALATAFGPNGGLCWGLYGCSGRGFYFDPSLSALDPAML